MASRPSELFLAVSFLVGQISILIGAFVGRIKHPKSCKTLIASAVIYLTGCLGLVYLVAYLNTTVLKCSFSFFRVLLEKPAKFKLYSFQNAVTRMHMLSMDALFLITSTIML